MVPSTDWFLYGFVRKEAVITSQIEGTQATLPDIVAYEATDRAERLDDVQEVCRPRTSRTRWRRWSDGGTLSATSRRWCVPGSRTCSSRRSTRSWTATAASAGC